LKISIEPEIKKTYKSHINNFCTGWQLAWDPNDP
jgi:hypothetical protein